MCGKIFATLPDPARLNVMLDADAIAAAVDRAPDCCDFVYWGDRLAAVGVDLTLATAPVVASLLAEAHARRAR